jgi:hypothetical protein
MSEPTEQAHGLPPLPDGPDPIARMAEVLVASDSRCKWRAWFPAS